MHEIQMSGIGHDSGPVCGRKGVSHHPTPRDAGVVPRPRACPSPWEAWGSRVLALGSLLAVVTVLAWPAAWGDSRAGGDGGDGGQQEGIGAARVAAGRGAEETSEGVERVREYLSRLEAFGLAGGLLLAREGRVLLARGYGLANRGEGNMESGSGGSGSPLPADAEKGGRDRDGGNGRAWTAATVSSVGSITKQFTAAAIMKLVDGGQVAVSDSLGEFFGGVPQEKRGITIHQLLTHTAGLGEVRAGDFDFLSRQEIVRRAMESELLWEPGTRYRYTNLGYSLLGAVVEVVTGEDYEGWLRRELFVPAGMYETGYLLPGYEPERIATGYEAGQRWGTVIERLDPATGPSWVLRANGGIHTTLYDMLRWVRALGVMPWPDTEGARTVLSEESRERMFTPHADEGGGSWYGYGWVVVEDFLGRPVLGHNGGNGILHADLHLFPEDGVLLFMMTSDADMRATRLLRDVDRAFFGQEVEMPPAVDVVKVSPARLRDLTGRYALDGGGELVVRSAGTALVIGAEGQAAVDGLWSGSPASTVPYDTLNRRAVRFVRAFRDGDYGTMREMMGPEAPEEPYRGVRERYTRMWGALGEVEVLGTVPAWFHGGSSEATWLRLHFQRRKVIRRIHWHADGTVEGVGGEVYPAPVTLRCAMTGPAACTGWHEGLQLGAPRVEFLEGRDGGTLGVTIRAPGGEVRGRRTG